MSGRLIPSGARKLSTWLPSKRRCAPLISAQRLAKEVGAEVPLKCENLQRTDSFKLRGAYTMIARLSAPVRTRGVVYSAGNHAQAVALAARLFKIEAVVVMPTDEAQVKIEASNGGARGGGSRWSIGPRAAGSCGAIGRG